jgi:PKD repeat protein
VDKCYLRAVYDNLTIASGVQVFDTYGPEYPPAYSLSVTPVTQSGSTSIFAFGGYFRLVEATTNASGVNLLPMLHMTGSTFWGVQVAPMKITADYEFLVTAFTYWGWAAFHLESNSGTLTNSSIYTWAGTGIADGDQQCLLRFDTDGDSNEYEECQYIHRNTAGPVYNITFTMDGSIPYGFTAGTPMLLDDVFNAPSSLGESNSAYRGDQELTPSWSIYYYYAGDGVLDIEFITDGTFGYVYDADFVGIPDEGHDPLEVTFTYMGDMLPGATYYWTFGDGATGVCYPGMPIYIDHEYEGGGYYTVSVTVESDVGNFTETKTDYILVWYPDRDPIYLIEMDWGIYWVFGLLAAFVTIMIMFKRGR